MNEPQLKFYQIPYRLIVVFLLLAMGIGVAGYLYYKDQEAHIKKLNENELSAVAELKADELSGWRQDRMADAEAILGSPFLTSAVYQWFRTPVSNNLKREILAWMRSFREAYHYETILLLDAKGTVQLSVPVTGEDLHKHIEVHGARAIQRKEIIFTDLHRVEPANRIHMTVLVPLLASSEGRSDLVGVVVLEIDPYRYLYPFIQKWPVPSRSSETLLIRREGDEVVYLNELRHQKNTALSLRIPLGQANLPAAMAAYGVEGTVEGVDYRGIRVLATIRRVSNSPWLLVAKIDQDEILAPVRERARMVGLLAGLMIIGTGVILGLFWSRQNAQAEIKRHALTRHFEYLTKHANDIILLTDENLKIMEANDRAVTSYGYPREELLQLTVRDLRSPETRAALDEQMDKVKESQGIVYETMHQRKDGTPFPVEVSTRIIEIEEKKFFQAIIRDITERKQAQLERERMIRELQEALSKVKTLGGLLPICASCKKIRDDKGYWNQIETYIGAHSEAEFSHGICPDCLIKLYPDLYKERK